MNRTRSTSSRPIGAVGRIADFGSVTSGIALAITIAMVAKPQAAAAQAAAQVAVPVTLADFLRTTVGLGASETSDAREGKVVVKLLHTDMSRDVAVFGMIGIHATRAAYVAHLRNVQSIVAARTQQFGIIADPVRPEDLAGFSFDASEWDGLKSCSVNNCDFKIPASLMQRFAQSVDWSGPDPRQQVDSVMRSAMQDLVSSYRARGNSAMLRYDDTHGVQSGDAFVALLDQSRFLREYVPAFREYLVNYPSGALHNAPDSALDVMYWSVDRIPHLRPTFTLNQMVVYTPPTGTPLVARKQIYADHYFEAAFELFAVFDAPDLAGGPGIYVVGVRRYRFDSLPGGFFNIRGRVRSQLQKVLKSDLERERGTMQTSPPA